MLVEVELLVLSLLAGAIAALAGVPIAARTGFTVAPLQLWLAVPVAVMTALVASLGPAVFVSRSPAVEVIVHPARLRRSRPLHGTLTIGFRGLLTEWRWEALIGVLAIAIGCTLIGGVVLIAEGFRGQLDVSVLGTFLTEQVRPFHIALALIVSTIGAVTVAQITLLAYLERRRHMAVLRALGWPTRSVAAVIVAQALTIAAAGGVVAVLNVLVVARLLHAPLASVLTSEMAVMAAASIAFVVATFAPLVQAYSGRIADSLRGE
jgi:hypothetical protein